MWLKRKILWRVYLGKQHKLPFPTKGRTRTTRIAQIVRSDVVGPMKTSSNSSKSLYFTIFKEGFSGYRVIFNHFFFFFWFRAMQKCPHQREKDMMSPWHSMKQCRHNSLNNGKLQWKKKTNHSLKIRHGYTIRFDNRSPGNKKQMDIQNKT